MTPLKSKKKLKNHSHGAANMRTPSLTPQATTDEQSEEEKSGSSKKKRLVAGMVVLALLVVFIRYRSNGQQEE